VINCEAIDQEQLGKRAEDVAGILIRGADWISGWEVPGTRREIFAVQELFTCVAEAGIHITHDEDLFIGVVTEEGLNFSQRSKGVVDGV